MTSTQPPDVRPVARLFKALSDETRVRLVSLLSHGELCVCHLQAGLELPQPTISRHLAVLRSAGVVESRREGTWIYYRLAPQRDAVCKQQLSTLIAGFAERAVLRRDVARLVKTRGPGSCA